MARSTDTEFEMRFFEAIHRRDPRYVEVVEILAGLYTKRGKIAEGLRMDRKLVRLQPENATAHYNLACSLALCKRRADAIRSLRRAVELGYDDAEWMEQDPDLELLKESPAFQDLLSRLTTKS